MQGAGGIEVRNRGEIRFAQRTENSCNVKLSFQFEVPGPLVPFAVALKPFGDNVLKNDMHRFQEYAVARLQEASAASL
jgi:uncharacterized membrane protein